MRGMRNTRRPPRFDLILDPLNPKYGTFLIGVNDSSGFSMQRAPEFTGNVAIDYSVPLGSGDLGFNLNAYYTSSFYFDSSEQFKQDGYGLVNGRVKWTAPGKNWSVGAFVQNLTNANYLAQALPATAAVRASYAEPRTYGVTLDFSY
jgi:iron complex outermembrane receptor protein